MDDNPLLPTADHPDDDRRLWLEEPEGEAVDSWVQAENARTLAFLDAEVLEKDENALKAAWNNPDKLLSITRRGDLVYNTWTDASHKRGLWRRTTMADYLFKGTQWENLLDIDEINRKENEDWFLKAVSVLPGDNDRALVKLSRGGGDSSVLREFDMTKRTWVEDGFSLPESKSHWDWIDRDTLVVAYAHPEQQDTMTKSGYPRNARVWERGTALSDARVIHQCDSSNIMLNVSVLRRQGSEPRIWCIDVRGNNDMKHHLMDKTSGDTVLDLPSNAQTKISGNNVLVQPRVEWHRDGVDHPADSVLAFDLDELIAGQATPQVLHHPERQTSVKSFEAVDGYAVLNMLDNLSPVCRIIPLYSSPSSSNRFEKTIMGLPKVGRVSIEALDHFSNPAGSDGTLLVTVETPLNPETLYRTSVHASVLEQLQKTPQLFNANGLTVDRFAAKAGDGNLIPYTITYRAESQKPAPVHLVGYGGFQTYVEPDYDCTEGIMWLERGAASVIAHIRGGGEFGSAWHEAGKGAKKSVSHGDFAAVARDLVARGFTTKKQIAAEGASNGGLLTANMFTHYPSDFGALASRVPLTDMRRYTEIGPGDSWKEEYLHPKENENENWDVVSKISAYHNIEPPSQSVDHPPTLTLTNRRDDRVLPGHGRKFHAKGRALGHEGMYFYEVASGGHGGSDADQLAEDMAITSQFLRKSIGMSD